MSKYQHCSCYVLHKSLKNKSSKSPVACSSVLFLSNVDFLKNCASSHHTSIGPSALKCCMMGHSSDTNNSLSSISTSRNVFLDSAEPSHHAAEENGMHVLQFAVPILMLKKQRIGLPNWQLYCWDLVISLIKKWFTFPVLGEVITYLHICYHWIWHI